LSPRANSQEPQTLTIMKRIDENYRYQDYNIHVLRGIADVNDMNWEGKLSFTLSKNGENIRGELHLIPLWLFADDEMDDPDLEYKKQYEVGDYFQHTFSTEPTRNNIGSILHDFIIENKNDLDIENVFSTKYSEDGHGISVHAENFWQKRIAVDKAQHDEKVNRHKIKFS
jgi:hypothetical protein